MTESPKPPAEDLPEYLSAGYITGPHDGTHGIFCADCALILRWRDRETPSTPKEK
jgi:hypothetical protein